MAIKMKPHDEIINFNYILRASPVLLWVCPLDKKNPQNSQQKNYIFIDKWMICICAWDNWLNLDNFTKYMKIVIPNFAMGLTTFK